MTRMPGLSLLLLFVLSCSDEPSPGPTQVYFDAPHYFNRQIRQLNRLGPQLEKELAFNRKKESKVLSSVNWEQELSLFTDIDINKAAWRGLFDVDTIDFDSGRSRIFTVRYSPLQEDIPVKKLLINIDRSTGDPEYIHIDLEKENFIYNSRQTLTYAAGKGYTISNQQKVLFLAQQSLEVESRFIFP